MTDVLTQWSFSENRNKRTLGKGKFEKLMIRRQFGYKGSKTKKFGANNDKNVLCSRYSF